MTIIGIAGSLRKDSLNAGLLRAAAGVAPEGMQVETASIRDIPVYDADVEAASFPAAVRDLKDRIASAQGLLLVTPEYNNSLPGVLKNAIDWLSRPASDIPRVFRGLPVALMGATPGSGATLLAQAAWLPVFRTLGMQPWFGPRIAMAGGKGIVDDDLRKKLGEFMFGFSKFVADAPGGGRVTR